MEYYNQLLNALDPLKNEQNALSMKAYMRHQFLFLGIKTPERKKAVAPIIKALKKLPTINWEFVSACYESEYREVHYAALDYLQAVQKQLTFADLGSLTQLATQHQWWDTIDRLDRIIGNIGLSDERMNDVMLQWSMHDDFWLRRIAIDHQLGRKEATNPTLLAQIIINNLGSDEFFINKAIGWSLREYAKTNPTWVEQFLMQYQPALSALSFREASKHLAI